jgi:hypothetical protein
MFCEKKCFLCELFYLFINYYYKSKNSKDKLKTLNKEKEKGCL